MKQGSAPVKRREIFGWAMFDFANSSYTTVIVTVAFSIYFTKMLAPADSADWWWGVAVAISNSIVLVTAPIIGAIADGSGRKKLFLAATYLVCVAGTAALYFVLPGQLVLGLLLFVVSNVAFSFGENFAGAFLPEISTPRNIGKISGFGWGLGYFGGLGSLVLVLPLLSGGFDLDNLPNLRLTWVATAGFFLVAGIPTMVLLRERAERGPPLSLWGYSRRGFRRLRDTLVSLRHFSELARFLVVFVVYSSGLMAVIAYAAVYAERTIGFAAADLTRMFIILQISSAGGALIFGWVQDRLGAKPTVQLTLVLWVAVAVSAYLTTSKTTFLYVALAAGLGIGSLQSASRAIVGLFSPPSKAGEFFGFWGLAQRAAYILGSVAFGAFSSLSGSQRTAILSTGTFFVVGLIAMTWISIERGRAAAESWQAPAASTPS